MSKTPAYGSTEGPWNIVQNNVDHEYLICAGPYVWVEGGKPGPLVLGSFQTYADAAFVCACKNGTPPVSEREWMEANGEEYPND